MTLRQIALFLEQAAEIVEITTPSAAEKPADKVDWKVISRLRMKARSGRS